MLSLTSEYALRAMVYLAEHEADWPVPAGTIARKTKIPAKYLSKILRDLVRNDVLTSAPGKTGGFRFRRTARRTVLYDVLSPFEQFGVSRCPFGNRKCGDEDPCMAHSRWKKVVEAQQRFLSRTTVSDGAAVDKGAKKRSRAKG